MIKEIELENFRSHKSTRLSFTEGNNILVGISGSGKSSVLDAICFALYGNIPKIQKRKLKVSELIIDKPVREESAKIKLKFEANNKNYEIKREIYLDRPSNAELREEGKLIAVNQSQVTEAVAHILKIDYNLFSKVIYAEQNQIDYFLTIPPGNRMNYIDELLKLSKFESARAKTIAILNKFKNLKNAKEEVLLGFNEKDLKDKKQKLEEYLNKINKEIILLEDRIKELKIILNKREEIFKELENRKTEVETRKNKIIEIGTKLSVFQSEIKEMPEISIEETEKKLKKNGFELEFLEKKELEREREISGITSKINELKKKAEEKKEAEHFLIGFNKEKFELVEKKIGETREKLLNKKLKKQELSEAVKNLKESREKCPTCDRELNEEKRRDLVIRKKRESFLLCNEISELDLKLLNKKKEFEIEKRNIEKVDFFKKRVEQLGNVELELTNLKEKLNELESNRIDFSGLKEEVQRLKTLYEKQKSIEIKKQKLVELNYEYSKIESEINSLSFDEQKFGRLRVEVEETKRELMSKELDFKYKKELEKEKEKNLEQLKKDLEFFEKNKEDIEFLVYAGLTLANFADTLTEIQEILRHEFVTTLNQVMNEIWVHIYPYEDYIGIRFKIENGDYLLQLCDLKNKWVNVEGFSSGGERAIASLVMRIALAIILAPNLKLLVLDEPTHNLDSKTIENLTEILRTKITELLEQTFIVTHDERLVQAGTAYIYEFRRELGKKEPTKIRELSV